MKVDSQLRTTINHQIATWGSNTTGRIAGRNVLVESVPVLGFFGVDRVLVDYGLQGSYLSWRPTRRLRALKSTVLE